MSGCHCVRPSCRWAILISLSCGAITHNACLAGVTIYGGPAYVAGAGGYLPLTITGITNAGTVVANVTRYGPADQNWGTRAVRWDGSGVAPVFLDGLSVNPASNYTMSVSGINASGTSVGQAYTPNLTRSIATKWEASVVATGLGNIGADPNGFSNAVGRSINDAGTIVGSASHWQGATELGSRAVRWNAGGTSATELGSLGGLSYSEQATAINASGLIAGVSLMVDAGSGDSLGTVAVRWDAGGTTATELGHLSAQGVDPLGRTSVQVVAINGTGTIIGSVHKWGPPTSGSSTDKGNRAVRWDIDTPTATELDHLSELPGSVTSTTAAAINAGGTIVGSANRYLHQNSLGARAVRWDAGGTAATELGTLGTDAGGVTQAHALAINDAGLIVGSATIFNSVGVSFGPRATYWKPDGTAVNLNTLIEPGLWSLIEATAVSNTGWIAGNGLYDPDGPGGENAYSRFFLIKMPTQPADFNQNGSVDATDLALWRGGFGTTGTATQLQGDADGDQDVDGADFLVWQRQLALPQSAVAAQTPVPEPATSLLFIVAAAGIRRMGGRMRQERANG